MITNSLQLVFTECYRVSKGRQKFFTGDSITTGGCFYACGSITNTVNDPRDVRTGLNLGVSPGVGLGSTIQTGSFLGNPHRYFFGPTYANSEQ